MEVHSEMAPAAMLRHATEILVRVPAPARQAAAARRRPPQDSFSRAAAPANLLLSGTVTNIVDGSFILRSREGGAQQIVLRRDTTYSANGESVGEAALRPNMRVFVKAAKTVLGDVEAYQVVWGGILTPAP
jgi:hypothetical protein